MQIIQENQPWPARSIIRIIAFVINNLIIVIIITVFTNNISLINLVIQLITAIVMVITIFISVIRIIITISIQKTFAQCSFPIKEKSAALLLIGVGVNDRLTDPSSARHCSDCCRCTYTSQNPVRKVPSG